MWRSAVRLKHPRLPNEAEILALTQKLEAGASQRPRWRLPVLVIDSMLPGQRLLWRAADEQLPRPLRRSGDAGQEVCVLGVSHLTGRPLRRGVVGLLQGLEERELKARQVVEVRGPAACPGEELHDQGPVEWLEVEELDDEVLVHDMEAAAALPPLVDEWCGLVRGSRFERSEGQISQILADLGPMPPAEAAGQIAFWVAALINPLPALGVAFEIRPDVLEAKTVGERVLVARKGIEDSIGHVSGKRPLF
eukprot:TRINITY_DN76667_c0_g1_i1.p1 TRINITY_DN76667_c0_g1~~TRINITY_DN76667_c0_g1_i1.p1  ORF type:complete len:264 (+),score=57.39 TRINITY_DN76667_c0_g1_i1:45-794(+)